MNKWDGQRICKKKRNVDRISGDTYAHKQEEAKLMRETEKELKLLVAEVTGKEWFYNTKWCKEEMEVPHG